MTNYKMRSMPEDLEAEAWELFEEWENKENDFVNPMEYIYKNASMKLKKYYNRIDREIEEAKKMGTLVG